MDNYKIGDRVKLIGKDDTATIAFYGDTSFASGKWVGVILDEPHGKNNGTVNGLKYFDCESYFGLFVRPQQIVILSGIKDRNNSLSNLSNVSSTSSKKSSLEDKEGSDNKATTSKISHIPAPSNKIIKNKQFVPNPHPDIKKGLKPPAKLLSPLNLSVSPKSESPIIFSIPEKLNTSKYNSPYRTINLETSIIDTPHIKSPTSSTPSYTEGKIKSPILKEHFKDIQKEHQPNYKGVPKINTENKEKAQTLDAQSYLEQNLLLVKKDQKIHEFENQIKDLNEKLEVLKQKRLEDRNKIKEIEKYKIQIQQLTEYKVKMLESHTKLQQELQGVKKELDETKDKYENFDNEIQELTETVEMATLDKEMAEEKIDSLLAQIEQLKEELEEKTLKYNHLQEDTQKQLVEGENKQEDKNSSTSNVTVYQYKQMEQQNVKMKEAVIKLRDIAGIEKNERLKTLKENEELRKSENQLLKEKEKLAAKLKDSETAIIEMREQLDAAMGAEEMVEALTNKCLDIEQKNVDLQEVVEDLEKLQEINEEIQENFKDSESELAHERDEALSKIVNLNAKLDSARAAAKEHEGTILKYRGLVLRLQEEQRSLKEELRANEEELQNLRRIPKSSTFTSLRHLGDIDSIRERHLIEIWYFDQSVFLLGLSRFRAALKHFGSDLSIDILLLILKVFGLQLFCDLTNPIQQSVISKLFKNIKVKISIQTFISEWESPVALINLKNYLILEKMVYECTIVQETCPHAYSKLSKFSQPTIVASQNEFDSKGEPNPNSLSFQDFQISQLSVAYIWYAVTSIKRSFLLLTSLVNQDSIHFDSEALSRVDNILRHNVKALIDLYYNETASQGLDVESLFDNHDAQEMFFQLVSNYEIADVIMTKALESALDNETIKSLIDENTDFRDAIVLGSAQNFYEYAEVAIKVARQILSALSTLSKTTPNQESENPDEEQSKTGDKYAMFIEDYLTLINGIASQISKYKTTVSLLHSASGYDGDYCNLPKTCPKEIVYQHLYYYQHYHGTTSDLTAFVSLMGNLLINALSVRKTDEGVLNYLHLFTQPAMLEKLTQHLPPPEIDVDQAVVNLESVFAHLFELLSRIGRFVNEDSSCAMQKEETVAILRFNNKDAVKGEDKNEAILDHRGKLDSGQKKEIGVSRNEVRDLDLIFKNLLTSGSLISSAIIVDALPKGDGEPDANLAANENVQSADITKITSTFERELIDLRVSLKLKSEECEETLVRLEMADKKTRDVITSKERTLNEMEKVINDLKQELALSKTQIDAHNVGNGKGDKPKKISLATSKTGPSISRASHIARPKDTMSTITTMTYKNVDDTSLVVSEIMAQQDECEDDFEFIQSPNASPIAPHMDRGVKGREKLYEQKVSLLKRYVSYLKRENERLLKEALDARHINYSMPASYKYSTYSSQIQNRFRDCERDTDRLRSELLSTLAGARVIDLEARGKTDEVAAKVSMVNYMAQVKSLSNKVKTIRERIMNIGTDLDASRGFIVQSDFGSKFSTSSPQNDSTPNLRQPRLIAEITLNNIPNDIKGVNNDALSVMVKPNFIRNFLRQL